MVMVRKSNDKRRMCIGYTNILSIDRLDDNTYELLSFLNVYFGYNQIKQTKKREPFVIDGVD